MSIFLNTQLGKNKLTPKQILSDPILFLAFGFGSGLAKKAPGTLGTLAAVPVYWLFAQTNVFIYSLLTLIVTVSGIWICDIAAKKLDEHDFGGIVWDEIAGYLITLWLVPFSWQAMVWVLFCSESSTYSNHGRSAGLTEKYTAAWASCWMTC